MRQILKQIILTAFFFAGASIQNYAAIASDVLPLRLNVPVTREFQSGERQMFSVEAQSGEALEVVADKRGVDIGLSVFAPDNGKISVSNAPTGFVGREAVFFVANQSGSYQIEIVSRRPGDFTGDFTINLINRRPSRNDDSERAAAMRLLGEAREVLQGSANRVEKADEAMAKLETALASFKKFNDLQNQANALFHIAYITGNEYGKDRQAAEIYEKAVDVWRKIDDDAGKAICLTHAANELRGSGDNEKSLVYFNEALSLNQKMKDQPDEAVTLSFLCRLYNNTQNFQKGFEACRASLVLTRDADPLTDYFTYSMLGNLFSNTGDTTSSLKYILISLERIVSVKEHLNPIRFASAQAAVANVFYQQKKYSEAIAYFEKSLLVSQALNRPIFTAGFLTELGSIYYDLGQYEKALSYGEKALALYFQFDTGRRFDALNIVARSCAALGQKERARQIFTESIVFFRHNKDRYAEADALYNLAQLEMSDGNLETARQYLQLAINISEIIRADLLGTNSRSSYLTILKSYYELEIELLEAISKIV